MTRDPQPSAVQPASTSNVTIAMQVLAELGGADRFVDIEDIAAKAFAIAPDRFGWRTRSWASWERVRTAFVHANQNAARRRRPAVVLSSRDGDAWRLTAEGVTLVRSVAERLPTRSGPARPSRRGSVRSIERVRQVRRHPAFTRFVNGTPIADLERYVLADLLLIPPDSSSAAARRKVDSAKAAALDVADDQVVRFLEQVDREVTQTW